MAIRYPIACTVAYASFLLELRIFVSVARYGLEPEPDPIDLVDAADAASYIEAPGGSGPDLPVPDVDEGIILFIPLLVVGAAAVAVVSTLTIAPTLVAELFLDVFVISSLARRFSRIEPSSWIHTAFRRTWRPFLGILILLAAAGFLANYFSPGAESIGDIISW